MTYEYYKNRREKNGIEKENVLINEYENKGLHVRVFQECKKSESTKLKDSKTVERIYNYLSTMKCA